MAVFKLTDNYIAFAHAVAGGMDAYKAYIEHIARNKKVKKKSASAIASKLMARPLIQDVIVKARAAREAAIISNTARVVAKEFSTTILTVGEMDAYHCAIIQGMVQVEEVVPTFAFEYDKEGRVIKRSRSFVKVQRPPNIREKQISISEMYKRLGSYAARKFLGAIGNINDEGELQNVERFVILASGEKIPL
jgi:hypothetical protein